jgi:hypothetical protein
MTSVNALQAAFEALTQHLKGASPLWGTRVQPLEVASATLVKPYVVMFLAADASDIITPLRRSAALTISIKGVATDMAMALAIDEALNALLDEGGRQDSGSQMPVHPSWDFLTITEGRMIYLQEQFAGAQNIYHAGHQYDLVMEHK